MNFEDKIIRFLLKHLLPNFLLVMSEEMTEQENRSTAHPFWQVRCKEYLITESGYNEHHWVLVNSEGEFYRSDKQELSEAFEYLKDSYSEWFTKRVERIRGEENWDDTADIELLISCSDIEYLELPDGVDKLYVQEVEKIVTTHFTEADALWFIERKQHDYPKLYTYVESAYWSPQIRKLQDWIISLT